MLQGTARGATPGRHHTLLSLGSLIRPRADASGAKSCQAAPPCSCSHFRECSSSLTSEPLQAPCSPLRNPLSFDPFHPALTLCCYPYILGSIFHQTASSGRLTRGLFHSPMLLQPSTAQVHDRHDTHSWGKKSEWSGV